MKTPLVLLLLIIFPCLSHGAMYKWTDDKGETIYSDTPPTEDTEEIKLPALTTTPAVKYKPKPRPARVADDATGYAKFTLTSPTNDAVFNDNTGNVAVSINMEPDLNISAGHSISLILNGATKISNSNQTTFQLSNLDRGEYSLHAEIRDAKNKLLKSSNSVVFTVFRASKLFKKPAPPPPAN